MAALIASPTPTSTDPALSRLSGQLQLGLSHLRAGDAAAAEAQFRGVLEAMPGNPSASYNLGLALAAQGRAGEALAAYADAVQAAPQLAMAHNNMALLWRQQGQGVLALQALERALAADPGLALAWLNLGNLHADTGFDDKAQACHARAVALDARLTGAWAALARLHARRGEGAQAVGCARQALLAQPRSAEARVLFHGMDLQWGPAARSRTAFAAWIGEEALDARWPLVRAVAAAGPRAAGLALEVFEPLAPAHAGVLAQAGQLLYDRQQPAQAARWFARCVALEPRGAPWHMARGTCLLHAGDEPNARASLEAAVALDDTLADAQWNLSLLDLMEHRWAQAWPRYEWRLDPGRTTRREALPLSNGKPRWQGEPAAGQTLLLAREQGYGDNIQFARFVRDVAALGARVKLAAYTPLVRLWRDMLRESAPQVEVVAADTQEALEAIECDRWAFLASLPLCLGLRAPPPLDAAYIEAPAHAQRAWRERLGPKDPAVRRIGLVWAGGPRTGHDALRSMHLRELGALGKVPGAEFHSLMVGEPVRQIDEVGDFVVHDWSPWLDDFAQTAALMSQLDLVIGVDTAVAHLAGAMDMPVWVAVSAKAHFSHLRSVPPRGDAPWYRSMKLYRQDVPGEWAGVAAALARDLAALPGAAPNRTPT